MENRQNKPPEGGAASGHGGQKFHTDSEQAKLHKSKLRMESREERLNKARERLAKQKPPKKPGLIKRIARIAGHETHAFLHGKVYQEERDNVGVEGGHFVERSGEAALHYGRHKVRRAIREHPAKAAARAESRYIKATADYHSRKFAQEQPEAQSAAARLWHRHKLKREYQRKARETAKQTAKAAEQTVSATERFVREAAAFVKRHPVGTLLYGDNVIEKHGINRDRTGDREKTRYLCGKQGIFTRDRALIRPGSIRQLETRASTRSASFFHALGGPGRPYNGGGAAGAYRTHNGAKPLKQGHLRAKRGPLGPSRKSQQQTKRTGFAAHGHSIAETASEGKRASRANGALNRAKINGRGQKQGFGGVDRRRGGVTSCYSRRYDDGGDRAITGGKCGKAILHFPHSRVEL